MSSVRQEHPRDWEEIVLYVNCFAPDDLFLEDFDLASEETKEDIEKNGAIPCEGGGVLGEWCENCRFGTVERD